MCPFFENLSSLIVFAPFSPRTFHCVSHLKADYLHTHWGRPKQPVVDPHFPRVSPSQVPGNSMQASGRYWQEVKVTPLKSNLFFSPRKCLPAALRLPPVLLQTASTLMLLVLFGRVFFVPFRHERPLAACGLTPECPFHRQKLPH